MSKPEKMTILPPADVAREIEAARDRLAADTGLPRPSTSAVAVALIRRGLATLPRDAAPAGGRE